MHTEVSRLSVTELAGLIRTRELSCTEAVGSILDQVGRTEPLVHALHTLDADGALAEAARLDRVLRDHGPVGPLHGVPVTVKDVVATRGIRTTHGSAAYRDLVPNHDAPSVVLLRDAGAVVIGKTTTPEFGHKAVTDGRLGPATANPWDVTKTAGGSSGGAAAAAACGMGPIAVGTDGGGSIRVPAALCGVFGVKPTTGTVPTYPPSAIGPLGHTGPITRTVADAAVALAVLQGAGPALAPLLASVERARDQGLPGLRVGLLTTVNGIFVEPELTRAVHDAAAALEALGAQVEPAELPTHGFEGLWDVLFFAGMAAQAQTIAPEEWHLLSDSFQTVVKQARAQPDGAAQLAEAQRVRLAREVAAVFGRFDVLLGPVVSVPAFRIGVDGPELLGGAPADSLAWWRLTQLWNLCGQPACSLPYGRTAAGLPIGVQLIARAGQDFELLRYAAALELPWSAPPVASERSR
ncbi:amidase [Rhizohabitans arisaemae]|uniref:amidase n=1 Tax=Rhizohabitans arisaemae TaxID=2720610 RepID=UPI0024B0D14C|nr:amidase family protein [Rhizohabitans arisaemae]